MTPWAVGEPDASNEKKGGSEWGYPAKTPIGYNSYVGQNQGVNLTQNQVPFGQNQVNGLAGHYSNQVARRPTYVYGSSAHNLANMPRPNVTPLIYIRDRKSVV